MRTNERIENAVNIGAMSTMGYCQHLMHQTDEICFNENIKEYYHFNSRSLYASLLISIYSLYDNKKLSEYSVNKICAYLEFEKLTADELIQKLTSRANNISEPLTYSETKQTLQSLLFLAFQPVSEEHLFCVNHWLNNLEMFLLKINQSKILFF